MLGAFNTVCAAHSTSAADKTGLAGSSAQSCSSLCHRDCQAQAADTHPVSPTVCFPESDPCPPKQLSQHSAVLILVPDSKTSSVIVESVQWLELKCHPESRLGHSLDSCIEGFCFLYCFVLKSPKFQTLHTCMLDFLLKKVCSALKLEERLKRQGVHRSLPVCKTLL